MNKKSIIAGVLIVLVVSLVTGCNFGPKPLNNTDFKEHFGALGYTISDTETGRYESDKYLVATKEDVPYKIEYYEFKEEVDAKKAYKNYKDSISEFITSDSKNQETTGAVFSKIVAVSTNEYIIISRVKNTLIFINGTKDYSTDIDKLLTDIKY